LKPEGTGRPTEATQPTGLKRFWGEEYNEQPARLPKKIRRPESRLKPTIMKTLLTKRSYDSNLPYRFFADTKVGHAAELIC